MPLDGRQDRDGDACAIEGAQGDAQTGARPLAAEVWTCPGLRVVKNGATPVSDSIHMRRFCRVSLDERSRWTRQRSTRTCATYLPDLAAHRVTGLAPRSCTFAALVKESSRGCGPVQLCGS